MLRFVTSERPFDTNSPENYDEDVILQLHLP